MQAEVSCDWQGGQGQCNTFTQAGYSRTETHCCLGVASLSWAFGSFTLSHQLKTSQKDVGINSYIPSSIHNTSAPGPWKGCLTAPLEKIVFPNWTTVCNIHRMPPYDELNALDVWRHCLSNLGLNGQTAQELEIGLFLFPAFIKNTCGIWNPSF